MVGLEQRGHVVQQVARDSDIGLAIDRNPLGVRYRDNDSPRKLNVHNWMRQRNIIILSQGYLISHATNPQRESLTRLRAPFFSTDAVSLFAASHF
jgi:hypothetical protein